MRIIGHLRENTFLRKSRTLTVKYKFNAPDLVCRFELVIQRVHGFYYLVILGQHAGDVVDQPLLVPLAGSLYCLHQ